MAFPTRTPAKPRVLRRTAMPVMTPAEFERMCAWLQGPEALNVHDDPDASTWDCDGTHRYTLRWLRANGVDVDANLALIRELGGCCCDCEVVLNVAGQARWPGQTPLRLAEPDQGDPTDLDDVPSSAELAQDDDALLDWLHGAEVAPPPPFLRNVRELHFHITFLNPDQAGKRCCRACSVWNAPLRRRRGR